jgi:nitrogen permease regulator 3-like protein
MTHALKTSSIAPAMKALYEAIKSRSIANISIHDLPLEMQLPPYLDLLLHNDDHDDDFIVHTGEDEETSAWGKDLGFAWRLPTLTPWKSLLLLDDQDDRGEDLYANLMGQHVIPEDRQLAGQLIKFLEITSVTLSFVLLSVCL